MGTSWLAWSLKFERWWDEGDRSKGHFRICAGDAPIADAVVVLFWELVTIAVSRPWALAMGDQEKARAELRRAVLRLGVRRISTTLRQTEVSRNNPIELRITQDDLPTVEELIAQKTCAYQSWQARDLYCSAASPQDETAVGTIGFRRLAPTSRAVCKACTLPDTDYICSHLLHPQISGMYLGPNYFRQVTMPLCDIGRPEIQQASECHAGGNRCWEYAIEPQQPAGPVVVAPRGLPDAFDHFDAIWRLTLDKSPLLMLKRAGDVAGLALPCTSADEFESRLSDLAGVLKALQVEDRLLPGAVSKALEKVIGIPEGTALVNIPKDQSLNRIAAVVDQRLQDPERQTAIQAITSLRAVGDLRVAA